MIQAIRESLFPGHIEALLTALHPKSVYQRQELTFVTSKSASDISEYYISIYYLIFETKSVSSLLVKNKQE